ncbi:MAG: tetratricopeptide repeat protein [Acidobacteriota bacterium]|nr:tetratricopeptide repeat protein [Acidobacteriota bacterium]
MTRSARLTPPTETKFRRAALGVFGLALAVRLIHVWQLRDAPFFNLPMGDAQSYHTWGVEIASGNWIGSETFYQAPLYPYFLGALYSVFGADLLAVRLTQVVIGAVSCVLLAITGRLLFTPTVGIVAGVMLALYAPAIFFDGLVQKTAIGAFLLCVLLALLSRLTTRSGPTWAWVWPGVTLGGLILTRENALVFVIVVLGWLALSRSLGKQRLAWAGAIVVGLAIVILPVAVRNKAVGGDLVLTTAQFGPNFYIGNNPNADGTYRPLVFGRGDPRFEREDATQIAERALGTSLTPTQVSRYWTRQSLDYMVTQPGDWMRLTGRKIMLAINAAEVADTEDQLSYSDWSVPLRAPGDVWHFGVLAPLAVAGIWLTWSRRRQLLLFYLLPGAYAASIVMFAVMGRYRYPLVPLLILFAAAGLVALWPVGGGGWYRRHLSLGAATAGMLVACNWPTLSMTDMRVVTALNLGTELQAQGRFDEAASQYRQVLAVTPDDALAHSNLGTALAAQGQLAEAVEHYQRAVTLEPRDPDSYSNLGNALLELGRVEEAVGSFRQALDIDPSSAEAHGGLGVALHADNQTDVAIRHLRRALDLGAVSADTHNLLGVALGSQNRLDEAGLQFRRALEIDPDYLDAHTNLAMAAQLGGDPELAIQHYREVLRIGPASADIHNELGLMLSATEKLAEATAHFTRAIQLDPSFAFAHANLGTALQLQGRIDDALRHYEQAVRLAPAVPDFQARLDAASNAR